MPHYSNPQGKPGQTFSKYSLEDKTVLMPSVLQAFFWEREPERAFKNAQGN